MADVVESSRDIRENSYDSLFEAPPDHEGNTAGDESNHVINSRSDELVDPPTPGGVFVTDDEDVRQHDMRDVDEFDTGSKQEAYLPVPESIFEQLLAAECAKTSSPSTVADAAPAFHNLTTGTNPPNGAVLAREDARARSHSAVLHQHVHTPSAVLNRTERLLAQHGSRAREPLTLFDGVQLTRNSASTPPSKAHLLTGYSSEESSDDDIGGIRLPSRSRDSIGVILQRSQDPKHQPPSSTPTTAPSLRYQPSSPPTPRTSKDSQPTSRHPTTSSQTPQRSSTTTMAPPMWEQITIPRPSPKMSGHHMEKKRAREPSPVPSILTAPKRMKGPFMDESSDEEGSELSAPAVRTTPISLTALAEQSAGITPDNPVFQTSPNLAISAPVDSPSPPVGLGPKKVNFNRLKQAITQNAQNAASREGQKQNANGYRANDGTRTGRGPSEKPQSNASLEATSKLNPKAVSRHIVGRATIAKDITAVQGAGSSNAVKPVVEDGINKPAMMLPGRGPTNESSGANLAKASKTSPTPRTMCGNTSHPRPRDTNVAQARVDPSPGMENGISPVDGSQSRIAPSKAPDPRLQEKPGEKKYVSNPGSKEPATKGKVGRRPEAPDSLLVRASDKNQTTISTTAHDLANTRSVLSQTRANSSLVDDTSLQVFQGNSSPGQQPKVSGKRLPKPSGMATPPKSASTPAPDTLPLKKKQARAQVGRDVQAKDRKPEPTIFPPPLQRKQTQGDNPTSSEKRKAEDAVDREHNTKKTARFSDIRTENKGAVPVAAQSVTSKPKDDAAVRKEIRAPPEKRTIPAEKRSTTAGISAASSTIATQKVSKASGLEAAKKAAHTARINEMMRARSAKLANAVKPTEVAKPVNPAKPVKNAESVTRLKPTESVKPATTPKPTEGIKPAVPVKPTEGMKPALPMKPLNPAQPNGVLNPPVPAKLAEIDKPAKQTSSIPNSKPKDLHAIMNLDSTPAILNLFPAPTTPSSQPSPPPYSPSAASEPLPFFHYTIHTAHSTSTSNPSTTPSTQLISHPYLSIELANTQAEQLINATRHHPSLYGIQFRSWETRRDEHDCLSFSSSFITLADQSVEKHERIWVARTPISKYANNLSPSASPPSTSTSTSTTPFLKKRLYILRLCRIIAPDDESDSSALPILQHIPISSLPHPIQNHHHHQNPQPAIQELHTVLDTANRAARTLQILLSHRDNPKNELDRMWQEEDNRRLWERVYELEMSENSGGESGEEKGMQGCWQSEFNGKEGEKYALRVERVGLCGPRNV